MVLTPASKGRLSRGSLLLAGNVSRGKVPCSLSLNPHGRKVIDANKHQKLHLTDSLSES